MARRAPGAGTSRGVPRAVADGRLEATRSCVLGHICYFRDFPRKIRLMTPVISVITGLTALLRRRAGQASSEQETGPGEEPDDDEADPFAASRLSGRSRSRS